MMNRKIEELIYKEDTKKLSGNEGISIYPYLWTKQGENVEECYKKAIPMNEIWGVENEFVKHMM
jgi:hypothetical protein